jgi:hypothetical protein
VEEHVAVVRIEHLEIEGAPPAAVTALASSEGNRLFLGETV